MRSGVPFFKRFRASLGFKMPNWEQIVRKKLHVGICPPEFTEELATHLEDSYEDLRSEGIPAEMAFQQAVDQVKSHSRLRLLTWFLQEQFMSDFISKAVLAGLVTAGAVPFLSWALTLGRLSPEVMWLVGGQLPTWWWCLLPLFGALGAFLSQYNGGSRIQRMAASLFPITLLCAAVLIIFVVGFTMSGFVNRYQLASARLESMGIVPPGFAIIPAAISLLGAGIAEVDTKKFRSSQS